MKVTAVIVAGGKGTRMGGGRNKVFLTILEREVLYYTISAFENNNNISDVVIVTGKQDIPACKKLVNRYRFKKISSIVSGGNTRQRSVMKGIAVAGGDIVIIHDGARALITSNEIDKSIEGCIKYGASAAGVKCKDTLKRASDSFISSTIDRETTYLIQTPQTFYLSEIKEMHEKAAEEGFEATDDCMIAEHYGKRIKISEGSYENIKLTTPEDMIIGERILKQRGYSNAYRARLRRPQIDRGTRMYNLRGENTIRKGAFRTQRRGRGSAFAVGRASGSSGAWGHRKAFSRH